MVGRRARLGALAFTLVAVTVAALGYRGASLASAFRCELGSIAYNQGLSMLRERPEEPNPYLDRALRHYLAAVSGDPGNAYAWRKLGQLYLTLGQNQAAVAALETALALRPGNTLYHILLGDAYDGVGLPEPAVTHWQLGDAGPWRHDQTVVNLIKLADAHVQAGDPLSAVPLLQDRVLAADPDNLYALATIVSTYDSAVGGRHPLAEAFREKLSAPSPASLRPSVDGRYGRYQARAVIVLYERGYWDAGMAEQVLRLWFTERHPATLSLAEGLCDLEPGEKRWCGVEARLLAAAGGGR